MAEPSVLDVVESIDRKLDEKNRVDEARFIRIEDNLREHDEHIKEHREQLASHNQLLREQAQAITTVAGTAARAVEHALSAKQDASRSVDEATKIVESAIRMHSASIATTVQAAVKAEVGPLVVDVDKLKENTAAQDTTLAQQDVKLDALLASAKTIVSAIGSKRLRVFLLACAAIGAIAGGAVAGWNAHEATKVEAPHH